MHDISEKLCRKCGEVKPISEFRVFRRSGKDRRCHRCHPCRKQEGHELYLKNKDRLLAKWNGKYKNDPEWREKRRSWHRKYGLDGRRRVSERKRQQRDPLIHYLRRCISGSRTSGKKHGYSACAATLEELRGGWTGFCQVCGISNEEHVLRCKKWLGMDHCHMTGKFRGFVCVHCNKLIACLEMPAEIVKRAVAFLSKNRQ